MKWFLLVLFVVTVYFGYQIHAYFYVDLEKEQENRAGTVRAILLLVAQVEDLRQKQRRIPNSEAELVKWRGRPMPYSPWGDKIGYTNYVIDPNHSDKNYSISVVTELKQERIHLSIHFGEAGERRETKLVVISYVGTDFCASRYGHGYSIGAIPRLNDARGDPDFCFPPNCRNPGRAAF